MDAIAVKEQLFDVINHLPEQEQLLLFEIAKRFDADDIATVDDMQAVQLARAEYAAGETVDINAIDWN